MIAVLTGLGVIQPWPIVVTPTVPSLVARPTNTPTPEPSMTGPVTAISVTPSVPTVTPSVQVVTPTISTPTMTPTIVTVTPATPSRTPTPIASTLLPGPVTDVWNFRVDNISDSEILVTVDYRYDGQQGEWVTIYAEATDHGVGFCPYWGWSWPPPSVNGGSSGSLSFLFRCYSVWCKACEGRTTDQVWVNIFRNPKPAKPFYSKSFDYIKTWSMAKK